MLDFRPEVARPETGGSEIRTLLLGRLQMLERMGLARAIGPAQWLLAEEAGPSLRELRIRGDIIPTMQRALSAQGQERTPTDLSISDAPITSEQTVIGRIVEKGLDDELKGSADLVVDGVDGRSHYLRLAILMRSQMYRRAGSSRSDERRGRRSDRTIARLAKALHGTYDPKRHRLEIAHANSSDPEALVKAHVRRLEALRRGDRIVERLADGRWKIPEEYLYRARAYVRATVGTGVVPRARAQRRDPVGGEAPCGMARRPLRPPVYPSLEIGSF